MSGSGPTSGWYSATGVKSRCAPSRAPASRTWLISSSSSEIARLLSASRAIAFSASKKLSTWSAICWAKSSVSPSSCLVSVICGSPSCERTAQRHLVGVLQVATYRQSTRQTRHAQAERLEHAGEVRRSRLALEIGVGREDHLGDRPVGEAHHQLADPQLLRADPVDRRDRPAEHVV